MALSIRPMSIDDVDAVYAIERVSNLSPWTQKIFLSCLASGFECFILENKRKNNSELLGYLIGQKSLNLFHIVNFSIAPHQRRQGFGRFFLNAILIMQKERKMEYVVLEVRPSNQSAIKLYESLGFTLKMIKEEYYHDEAGIEDGWVYRKLLIKDVL